MNNFFQNIDNTLRAIPDEELMVWPCGISGKTAGYTGREIHTKISDIRQELCSKGIVKGQRVLPALPIGYTLICTILALIAMGAIPVLPPARATKISLVQLLIASEIKAVVTEQRMRLPLLWLLKGMGIEPIQLKQDQLLMTGPTFPATILVSGDQAALISHSSGSTGKAKSIHRSHRVLEAQHQVLKEMFPPWASQRDFPLFPNILLHNLSIGTVSILPDLNWADLLHLNASLIVQQIQEQKVETLTGNAFYFNKICSYLEKHTITLPEIKAAGIGGSPVPERLAQHMMQLMPNAAVYIIYGSSEAEPIAVRRLSQTAEDPIKGYAVGQVHHSLELQIIPLGEVLLPDGLPYTAGEVTVRGGHVAVPSTTDWLHTGDFGYLDKDNNLYLTGRKGNERIHMGFQHYQLEHVLLHLNGVELAAARSTEKGFNIYIQGTSSESIVRDHLLLHFPARIIRNIYFRKKLEVDARHHSKVLYTKLN